VAASIEILPNAPSWFRTALAVPCADGSAPLDGASIHYLAWGQPGQRGLVFVHGGGAHAHWWTHVAATFAGEFRVLAMDLSGHGDSDHRAAYELDQWTREVLAVAEAGGIEGPPVLIGHSMGGFVTIATAALHPRHLAGVIVCDSPVTAQDPEVRAHSSRDAFGQLRTYPTIDEALARFRTVPEQEHNLDFVIDHVARRSLREVNGGWQWKFDPHIFESFGRGMRGIAKPLLAKVDCRLALLRSEFGLVTPDIGDEMFEALGRVAPVIELPQTGHHPMLDQPLILLTAIRSLLADWEHSEPHRPRRD
jgi:pimeloyl-ACP methyl ester carboxylesterase